MNNSSNEHKAEAIEAATTKGAATTTKAVAATATKATAAATATGLTGAHVALILGALLIIGASVVTTVILTRSSEPAIVQTSNTGIPVVTAENVLDIESQIKDKVEQGMFETHMNTVWRFPDGKSPSSDAIMGNAASNNYDFYFTVTLTSTQEVVFTSGILPVGSQIAEIVLEKELEAGTYPARIDINMVDEDGNPINSNMGIGITIEILS